MDEKEQARLEIERIDAQMAALFEARMKQSEIIAAYKKERGLPVRDETRERALLDKNASLLSDPAAADFYVPFQKQVVALSCRYQERLMQGMRVAYCGVEGAFAHIAVKRMFPQTEAVACADFEEAYRGTQDGRFDCAVLPVENSSAGEVGSVADLLFSGDLFVNRMVDMPVRHALVGLPCATVESVKKVISHPQALAQCGAYLHRRGLSAETYSNTAAAAKFVAETGDATLAAIASEETAALFGLTVLENGINDSGVNTTRFAVLSRVANKPAPHAADNGFLLMFTVQDRAGALAQTLNIIGAHGYNMRCLRSRPLRDLPWNYYFYIEAEGNPETSGGRDMMRELAAVCDRLRIVGTYKADETI